MRGRRAEPPIIPVGTLISLASLDSFPLEGGSHYGTRSVRPYGRSITAGRPHPPRYARHLPLYGKVPPPQAATAEVFSSIRPVR